MQTFLLNYKVNAVSAKPPAGQNWGIEALNVPDTWKVTKGKGIKVMVIDTGSSDHPNLTIDRNNSKNFCKTETIWDENGHSTHCCGIIAAKGKDNLFGVAPEAEIITCKVLDREGYGDNNATLKALRYAAEVKPDVISMSLGYYYADPRIAEAIRELYKLNIPIVAAAGNDGDGNKVNFPARHEEVICVAAYDKEGNIANFSNQSNQVDFAAPGVNIYSTWLNGGYASISGTSMATPFVAGIVALLIAKHRKQEKETGMNDCKTVDQIKQHLIKYSDDKGVVGKDKAFGYGVIDAGKLLGDNEGQKKPSESFFVKLIKAILSLFK
jgi:subtilisin family serine protease